MTQFAKSFINNESGATAIEYGLIAALIAVAAVGVMFTLGKQVNTTFLKVQTNMQKAL